MQSLAVNLTQRANRLAPCLLLITPFCRAVGVRRALCAHAALPCRRLNRETSPERSRDSNVIIPNQKNERADSAGWGTVIAGLSTGTTDPRTAVFSLKPTRQGEGSGERLAVRYGHEIWRAKHVSVHCRFFHRNECRLERVTPK